MALGAMFGLVADKAEAVTIQKTPVTSTAMESFKSESPVLLSGLEMMEPAKVAMNKFAGSPFKLAFWHNNIGTHTNVAHTNNIWSNSVTHNNVAWDNSASYSHTNAWQNTPHSNLPPVDHTNVTSGDVPQDYLY